MSENLDDETLKRSGMMRGGQEDNVSGYLIGSDFLGADTPQYTDGFFAAKKSLDDVLVKADSSVNLVAHAAVMPFLDQEAKIVEGFRAAVDKKDAKTIDDATSAMKQLASLARQHFINASTGELRSQTKEAGTQLLMNSGGDIEKFKQDVGDTMSWLKWAAIIGAAILGLGVVGIYIVPLIAGARRR